MFEGRTHEQQEKLPTQRAVVVVGIQQISQVIDNLCAMFSVKPELKPGLEPVLKQCQNVKMNYERDVNELEEEWLEKEKDCVDYGARLIQLTADLEQHKMNANSLLEANHNANRDYVEAVRQKQELERRIESYEASLQQRAVEIHSLTRQKNVAYAHINKLEAKLTKAGIKFPEMK